MSCLSLKICTKVLVPSLTHVCRLRTCAPIPGSPCLGPLPAAAMIVRSAIASGEAIPSQLENFRMSTIPTYSVHVHDLVMSFVLVFLVNALRLSAPALQGEHSVSYVFINPQVSVAQFECDGDAVIDGCRERVFVGFSQDCCTPDVG